VINSTEITQKLLDVQPLTAPKGLIYFVRYRYAAWKEKQAAEAKERGVGGRMKKETPYRSIDDSWYSLEAAYDRDVFPVP
jgi:hypothetical protein